MTGAGHSVMSICLVGFGKLARQVAALVGDVEPERHNGVFRIERACLGEVGDRLGQRSGVHVCNPSSKIGCGILGIEADRLVVVGDREVEVAVGA